MLQPQPRLLQTPSFEIPAHFEQFATTSIDILQQAHMGTLEGNPEAIRLSSDMKAHRVFIEQKLPEASRDYELLAIHLGSGVLTVCMQHRHDTLPDDGGYAQSTLVFERDEVRAFHSNIVRMGPMETVTENQEAGQYLTDRLFHSLGTLGIAQSFTELELPKAS